jgi:uncharacterized membrane protein YphA (DoxX/SURF4 family)
MATATAFEANDTATRTARSIARHIPTAARILLGALFLLSGLVGLLAAPQPAPGLPEGAIAFSASLMKTGYMVPLITGTEAIAGVLLLANRFVPLALALLAPVVVNIVAFHLFLEPSGLVVAVVVAALEIYLAWGCRNAFRPMLTPRTAR